MGDTDKLKGWKVDIRSYTATISMFGTDGRRVMKDGAPVVVQDTMDVQEDLAQMLFHTGLKQGPDEMFKAKDLADKIRAAHGFVLLDQKEMDRVMASYKLLTGLPEHYMEFLRRIRDAEEVPLKEDAPA